MLRWILWAVMRQPSADAAAPALQWDAPARCPSYESVRGRIAALTAEDGALRRARVQITERADDFVARIELDAGAGATEVRELTAADCEALTDAAALVIALAPERARPDDAPPPIVAPREPPVSPTVRRNASPPAVRPSVPVTSRRAPARALRLAIAVAAGPTLRVVPHVAPTLAGGVALLGARWRVDLRAVGTTPTRVRLAPPNERLSAAISSGVADLRAAYVPRAGPIELPLHAGVELGAAIARSYGGDRPRRGVTPLVGLTTGLALAWAPVPWFALRAEATAVFVLARPKFGVHTPSGDAIAFASPWVGVRALGGVEFRVPVRSRR